MEDKAKHKRMRRVSTWISDSSASTENEEAILTGKRIVLKILRYMEANHMTQKELAEKLNVSPQYINKFLHGQDCDLKISTALRYGKILNLNLIEIPSDTQKESQSPTIIYVTKVYGYKPEHFGKYTYDKQSVRPFILN